MKRVAIVTIVAVLSIPAALRAEQQVTLKSGVTLTGDVKFDGDAIVIDIDGATNRIPLADLQSVTAAKFSSQREAQRLLIKALESRLRGAAPKEIVVLLAEASQLHEDDPHIAYWLADSLVDAGYGKIARTKFEAQRAAIEEAYPAEAARLVQRIEQRVLVESLPPDLVVRIDEFNEAAANKRGDPNNPGMHRRAATFRLLDQNKTPIDQSAVQVQANGGDEQLEQFADGYYFYSYRSGNDDDDEPCRLTVSQYGLQQAEHQIRVRRDRVAIERDFTIRRFGDGDKRPVRILLADRDGKPMRGVRVALQAYNAQGGGNDASLSAESDGEGKAVIQAYPGNYGYQARLDGYNPVSGQLQIGVDNPNGSEQRVVLHRAIPATLRVVWQSKSWQPGAGVATGEATLEIDSTRGNIYPSAQNVGSWLRPMQVDDKLVLQVIQVHYGPMGPGSGPTVRKLEIDDDLAADELQREAQQRFKDIDLAAFDKLGEEYAPAEQAQAGPGMPQYGGGTIRVLAKPGDVFVGRVASRDNNTGQPIEMTFKAFMDGVAAEGAAEARP